MTEPIDIDELRRNLAHDTASPSRAIEYCDRIVPRLLDALAALRIAAEPLRKMNETVAPFKAGGAMERLSDACAAVKLPEGAKK